MFTEHCKTETAKNRRGQNKKIREGGKKTVLFFYFELNFGLVGVKSPKLFNEKTMSCLYGIFDHSKNIKN